jgi:hypothetical protein
MKHLRSRVVVVIEAELGGMGEGWKEVRAHQGWKLIQLIVQARAQKQCNKQLQMRAQKQRNKQLQMRAQKQRNKQLQMRAQKQRNKQLQMRAQQRRSTQF